MANGIKLDTREFNRALDDYAVKSSKDKATIVNGKMKDWMYRAAQFTPITQMTVATWRGWVEQPRLMSHIANKTFGPGTWGWEDRADLKARMLKRRIAKGYMKSGFAKAGHKFRSMVEGNRPGKSGKPRAAGKYPQVRVQRLVQAQARRAAAMMEVEWGAAGGTDADDKEKILMKAFQKALNFVERDMRTYIEKKMAKRAKEISA